jgi:tRNA modification GTPase
MLGCVSEALRPTTDDRLTTDDGRLTTMYEADTIAAIATPPGPGGIGVVRVSGPAAERLAGESFRRRRPGAWQTHRLYHGRIIDGDGAAIDDGLAVLMRAPRSYTGEDVLELHCHGSPILLRRVLHALMQRGARPARAGEFTKRAFLNGKLDLAQAEAVAELVRARTSDSASVAADHLFGHLSAHLTALREQLIAIKARLEASIDFSDSDVVIDLGDLLAPLDSAAGEVAALRRTYARGRLLREGLRVAIIGLPNVGKSSLLNALLGAERAIVTAVPGTTRDVLEDCADFDGVPVILFDTAGLREAADEAERIGVDRAQRVAAGADLVLVVLDTARALDAQRALLDRDAAVVVLNKIDLPSVWSAAELAAVEAQHRCVRVSATVPLGLDALRQAVTERASGQWSDNLPTLTSARQHDALVEVEACLTGARAALRDGLPADLIAVDVQLALDHIGTVTGLVTSEDVLDAVFRDFCIGK